MKKFLRPVLWMLLAGFTLCSGGLGAEEDRAEGLASETEISSEGVTPAAVEGIPRDPNYNSDPDYNPWLDEAKANK